MSTEQHESLKLADDIKGSGQFTPLATLDKAEAMLRASHALIVQMAEALTNLLPCLEDYQRSESSEAAEWALQDATQYLTRGPKP